MRTRARTRLILATVRPWGKVTKVLKNGAKTMVLPALIVLLSTAAAYGATPDAQCPQSSGALYSRIRSVGLDPQRVYRIREGSIDRPNVHFDFEDGTIAFTQDICGRITGAYFEGEGEIRLRPPNRMERGSLALFTGMAILVEQFNAGYLRFNDETASALQPFLLPLAESSDFIKRYDEIARELAEFDALRLLLDFSHFLPSTGAVEPPPKFMPLLHAHLTGKKLGAFEVFWDAATSEPLWAGQPKVKDGILFFDIWTAFTSNAASAAHPQVDASITAFRIRASVQPPTMLRASTDATLRVRSGGERTLLFELSRYLKVTAVQSDGQALDFIQNPAREGTQLQRRGNDLIAVIFPAPLRPTTELNLSFSYAGEVLSEAANGLLYVGERGTWYPNFGLSPAQFDLEFRYPPDWTLVATGKNVPPSSRSEASPRTGDGRAVPEKAADNLAEKTSRWISERQMPVAGFNLGKYTRAQATAGNILVEAYGTKNVEKSFPKGQSRVIEQFPELDRHSRQHTIGPVVVVPPPPSPARDAQAVADNAARAITSFSRW